MRKRADLVAPAVLAPKYFTDSFCTLDIRKFLECSNVSLDGRWNMGAGAASKAQRDAVFVASKALARKGRVR